jgi:glycerol-3-phosphate dehydrogenase (NAD(P)+)
MTLSAIIEEEIPQADVAVLSGPSHAEEVGRGIPTTIVVGAKSKETAEYIQNVFMSDVFRVYISPDVLGIELGAALKNVVALAAGIADGLGYGDNTKAALITRGIAEIARLGGAMGAKVETFCGLSGIGDLIVTCASMHSRNRRAGILIGQGKTMDEAMAEVKMVVEGVYSAKAAMGLAKKYNVELPIIEQVNKVLFDGKAPDVAVKDLMVRDRKVEVGHIEVTGWN